MPNALIDEIRSRATDDAAPFLIHPDGRVMRYGDLWATIARQAHALQAAGVQPGDRVAVQVEKSVPAMTLFLAAAAAGAVLLPLNTAYTAAEIDYFLTDAAPALFICSPAVAAARMGHGGPRCETLDAAGEGSLAALTAAGPADFSPADRGPEDLAALLYTSGTTGRAKGAMLSHENLASNARTLVDAWRFTAADRLIHALPIFHTHGLFVATNTVLFAGAAMHFLPGFEAGRILDLMADATVLMGVPTFYTRLLQQPRLNRETTAGMRLFVSGSAPLLAETHRAFEAATGHRILERYGMTETNMNTSNPYDGARVPGAVGPPLPGVSVRVTEPETGMPVAPGAVGMIEVKGPNVFKGYWRMPEKTAAEFRADGFFITGDLGRIDEAGYVHIVGRGKDLIITGGFNVYPKEVESEIDALEGVVESAVIGLPHADFGEAVTAVVVPVKGAALDEASVLAALQGRLAKFKQPKRVLFVADLPRNTMGKVQKNLLREAHAGLYAG